jgi:DNA helicase-2/ATP-dependent DNA helicase PcrA
LLWSDICSNPNGRPTKENDDEKDRKLLLDFDDLLVETFHLLNDDDGIRSKWQERFSSILVDEYQDTNPVQCEILKLLVGTNHNHGSSFWVAGDDHQAIYSFTGASVGNILNFQSMFPDSRRFILDLNYRSTPQILNACQNLIRHNVNQIHKDLQTHNSDGEDVIVLEASNEQTEALG